MVINVKDTPSSRFTPYYIMKKETWKYLLQTLIAVLTAIATSLGVASCMI